MTESQTSAQSCLVAVCAHLSMTVVRDVNFAIWLEVLREVLPDCENCPQAMIALCASAEDLAFANDPVHRETALGRLKFECSVYYQKAAGLRLEGWRRAAGRVQA